MDTLPPPRSLLSTTIMYCLMLAIAAAALLVIRNRGEALPAPAMSLGTAAPVASGSHAAFTQVLVVLAVVAIAGLVLGRLVALLGQPPVIGEVLAGILLGPSLLGPELSSRILPASVAPFLGVIAQLGVTLYMFVVGLELHTGLMRGRAHAAVIISHASVVAPFVLGSLLALQLYPFLSSSDVPFMWFSLFMGVAMSVTAFPVLARILDDRGMTRSNLGVIALTSAAVGDITAWCMLAFVVALVRAEPGHALGVTLGAIAYIAIMVWVVRPLLRKLLARWNTDPLPKSAVGIVFVALLLSALATEAIGIHAIFGAFLLGALIPHESAVAKAFTEQLRPVVTVLLLPTFFAFTGMRTRIDIISGAEQWIVCGFIIATAILGKFGGTFAGARLAGLSWRPSAALGLLMNTRGLMELIVLNIGLDLKIISPTLFSMLVLMALVTTAMTSPLLLLVMPDSKLKREAS